MGMTAIAIKPVTQSAAVDLIQANIDRQRFHAPWV